MHQTAPMSAGDLPGKLFFWQVQPEIQTYRLHRDDPAEDDDVEDGVPGFVEWELPSRYATVGIWCNVARCLFGLQDHWR